MKLLGAEEEELAKGDGERTGQLGEAERRRIAAKEEVEDELLARRDAGDETATVFRESGGDHIVRAPDGTRQPPPWTMPRRAP